MFQQARGKSDGGGRAQTVVPARRHRFAQRQGGAIQKNSGAIDTENLAEEQQKLFEHGLRIQGMGENGRKIAQNAQGLRRIGGATRKQFRWSREGGWWQQRGRYR